MVQGDPTGCMGRYQLFLFFVTLSTSFAYDLSKRPFYCLHNRGHLFLETLCAHTYPIALALPSWNY